MVSVHAKLCYKISQSFFISILTLLAYPWHLNASYLLVSHNVTRDSRYNQQECTVGSRDTCWMVTQKGAVTAMVTLSVTLATRALNSVGWLNALARLMESGVGKNQHVNVSTVQCSWLPAGICLTGKSTESVRVLVTYLFLWLFIFINTVLYSSILKMTYKGVKSSWNTLGHLILYTEKKYSM